MFNLHHPPWNPGYRPPLYFVEGMRVLVPIPRTNAHVVEGKTYCCWAAVVVAAGNTARVVNVKHNILQWVELEGCAITDEEYEKQRKLNAEIAGART